MLTTVRFLMRTLPRPARERLALRFFTGVRHYDEPKREQQLRARGTPTTVAGCHATAFGPKDAPVVLLIHGWSGRGLQLGAWVDPLVDAGHHVVAMDGPQHGRNPGKRSGVGDWVPALMKAIEELGPVAIVGHSFGSQLSVVAANQVGWSGKILCLGGPADMEKVVERFRNYVRAPERDMEYFIELGSQWAGVPWRSVVVADECHAFRGRLHAIVSLDDDDIPWDESAKLVEDAGGTVTVLEDAGHRGVMWRPEALDAGLDFLLGGSR